MPGYKGCCCYRCSGFTKKSRPDCACEDAPIYSQSQCMDCPKRHFCDVTKQPQLYLELAQLSNNNDYTAALRAEIMKFDIDKKLFLHVTEVDELATRLNAAIRKLITSTQHAIGYCSFKVKVIFSPVKIQHWWKKTKTAYNKRFTA